VFRRLGTLVWGALGAFHLWLLAGQVWNGQVEYADFGRWTLALGLAGALVALRRHGGSLFGNRRATAIWVLVALLHGPGLAENAGLATKALAETPAVAAQILCVAAGLGLALTLPRAPAPGAPLTASRWQSPAGRRRRARRKHTSAPVSCRGRRRPPETVHRLPFHSGVVIPAAVTAPRTLAAAGSVGLPRRRDAATRSLV
jgi:hypothetical protein